MYAQPKTSAPSVEEINEITKGFSRIKFDDRFLSEDLIVVTDVSAIATPVAESAATSAVRPPPPPPSRAKSDVSESLAAKPAVPKPAVIEKSKPVSVPQAPPPPVPPPLPVNPGAIALYAFAADSTEKISLTANEEYEVLDSSNDAWWLVQKGQVSGWAPASYLQMK